MKETVLFFNVRSAFRVLLLIVLISSVISFPQGVYAQGLSFPAEINKEFSPISITAGGISRLSVTIFNPNSFQLNNAAWSDNLVGVQPGISIANPANTFNSCGGTVSAPVGATSLSLTGGSVPPQSGITPGSCVVSIDVTSTTPGNLINTIPEGGLTGIGGGGTITNTTPASATLRVGAVLSPEIGKLFTPNTMWVGQVSQLTIAVSNVDPSNALTQASLTDSFPANVVIASPASTDLTDCGASASLIAVSGSGSITLSNATIAPASVCLINVNVTSNVTGAYVNTIPADALQTLQGVTNSSPVSAPLNVQGIGAQKSFFPEGFQAGGTTTLTITLQNPTGSPLTGVDFSDVLPGTILSVVNNSALTTCGGGTATTTLPRTVTLTNGTVPAGTVTTPGTCTVTVQATVPVNSFPETFTNIIPEGAITTDQGIVNVLPATAPVYVYAFGAGVNGVKSFTPSTIEPGDNSLLTIYITAPLDTNLTNFSIVDSLPAGVVVSNSLPATKSADCGASSTLIAVTGATSISLSGGTIPARATCQIDVYVTSAVVGVHANIIDPGDITNDEGRSTSTPIVADLTVRVISDLTMSKVFSPDTVSPDGISTLTITLTNANDSTLTNVSLLDTLPGNTINGIVIAPTPNQTTTCGSGTVTVTPGGKTISMSGGSIPAQVADVAGVCTIRVDVQGVGVSSIVNNIIPVANVSGVIQGTTTTINPNEDAIAPFEITDLSIGVVKGFNPLTVFGGSASTMTVELVNPNNAELVGIAFTDTMPDGMIVANPPSPAVGDCGGSISATPGAGSFSFSGGSLPPFESCTLTLNITMTVNGNLTNVIAANAVTTTNGASNPQPAEASLTNLPGAHISKSFSPNPINVGEYSLLTITIQNTGNVPITGMGLSDILPGTLPTGLAIAGASAPIPVNNCEGSLSAVTDSQTIQLTGGTLLPDSSCTIVVAVTSNETGSYQNIIPAGKLISSEGATNTVPATDTLVVLSASATASLGNRVWNDLDADGVQDSGEIGVSDVTVNLYSGDGTFVASTTTSGSGLYLFDNLTPGDYYVEFILPTDYVFSPQDQGVNDGTDSDANITTGETITTTLIAGENDLTWDAGIYQLASLGDRVWNDLDADGVQDSGEIGVSDVTVNLYSGDGTFVASTTTSGSGLYLFDNLTPGDYYVEFILPADYLFSPQDQGVNDGTDSDANITTGETITTTLIAGENDLTWDAGIYQLASLGDRVWNDLDADGVQDSGEIGVSDVTVNLYSGDGTFVASTTTSGSGLYLFDNLTPGDYYVEFILPADYLFSPQDQGVNDGTDSDANITTGETITTTLIAGENDLTWDAGIYQQSPPSGLTKTIDDTSLPSTAGNEVAIGELITYRVDITIPPGIHTNARLVDEMDRGLAFVECVSIDAPGLTTDITGSFADICSNPTTDSASLPMDVDRNVTFNFGTLSNNSQSGATLTITYRAIVLDIATNIGIASNNTTRTVLNNSAVFTWTGGETDPAQTEVTVIEPNLQIEKTSNVSFIGNGAEVTFTLTISHTDASLTDAFDVVVTDILPTGLDYVAGSLECTGGAQDPDVECAFDNSNPTEPTIRAEWSVFTLDGGNGQIRFRAVGNASIPSNGNVTNTANVQWTSMPGVRTTPTSYSDPANQFATERYYDPDDLINLYGDTDALTLTPLGGGDGGGGNPRPPVVAAGGFLIPVTGFAPNTVTVLNPAARAAYNSTGLTVEIPVIGVKTSIVGVELKNGNWDVSWLQDQAGWLDGTAYPTWTGNSVLTAHSVNKDGKAGVFSKLKSLKNGEYIFVYNNGYRYTYKVVSNATVKPNDISVLAHEEKAYLTLITCDNYDELTGTYLNRVAVRAQLVDVSRIK